LYYGSLILSSMKRESFSHKFIYDMKKLLFTISFLLIGSQFSFAQLDFNDFLKTLPISSTGTNFAEKQTTIVKGNPYLSETWTQGHLYAGGKKSKAMPVRYNLAEKAFEVQTYRDVVLIDAYRLDKVELMTPKKKVFKNGFASDLDEDIDKTTMFQVIYDGNVKILKKDYVKLIKAVATYGTANKEDVYKKYSKYYFYNENKEYDDIKLKRKDIVRKFDKKNQKAIEKYAKENNLKFDNEVHLSAILTYAESL